MTDADWQAELIAHAQGRVLDRVFPPDQCDDTWADRYYGELDRGRRERGA